MRPLRRPWVGVASFVAMALAGLVVFGVIALRSGPVPFALGLVLALIPVPVLAAGLLGLDRFEPEPVRLLVFTFAWGATAAALIALILNTADLLALRLVLQDSTADFLTASLGAPLVEECAKGAVILILLRTRRHELDGPIDGIVYGGLVGLGFAMTENVLYYSAAALQSGTPGLVGTFVLRGVFSPFLHPLFSSATGIGLGYSAIARSRAGRGVVPLAGLAVAVTLHAIWNTAAEQRHLVGVYLFVMMPMIAAILVLAGLERRRIRRLMWRFLPGYVQSGWLVPADLPMLTSMPARRRARSFVAVRGPNARQAMRDYQAVATELAFLHDRGERRQLSPTDFLARQRALLGMLAAARQGFSGFRGFSGLAPYPVRR